MRRIAAARFADGCVRELRSRPPEILFLGARVSHDVKCLSVAHRRHVGADLGDQLQRGVRCDAVDLGEIDAAGQLMERRTNFKPWFVIRVASWSPWIGERRRRSGPVCGQRCTWASMARSQAAS